jgi:hypothetical protein
MKFSTQWFFESDEINPFESPQAVGSATDEERQSAKDAKRREIGRLFWRWEKLRILYNAILTVEVLAICAVVVAVERQLPPTLLDVDFYQMIVMGCLAANLLFLLGHYVNAYLVWIGFRQRIYTILIFIAGMLIAGGLAAAATFVALLPFPGN